MTPSDFENHIFENFDYLRDKLDDQYKEITDQKEIVCISQGIRQKGNIKHGESKMDL